MKCVQQREQRSKEIVYLSIEKVEKGPSTGIVPQSSLFETSLQKKLKIALVTNNGRARGRD